MKKASKNKHQEILLIINQLSSDEDTRQDLWVAYLSNSSSSISDICQPSISHHIEDAFKSNLQQLIYNPPSQSLMDRLTEKESVVVCLLLIGCDIGTIGRYTGLDEEQVRRVIASLDNDDIRETLHGIEASPI